MNITSSISSVQDVFRRCKFYQNVLMVIYKSTNVQITEPKFKLKHIYCKIDVLCLQLL